MLKLTGFIGFIAALSAGAAAAQTSLYTDHYGNTTGTIGGKAVNCYTNAYGNTSCN